MKRLLAFALALASLVFVAAPAEAKTAASAVSARVTVSANAPEPQWRNRGRRNRWRRRHHRGDVVHVTTQTRLVRVGWRVYRETYQVRFLPNGRTRARLISRVRVR
jgi:hypothetical protein